MNAKEQKSQKQESKTESSKPQSSIVKHPLSTEKSIRLMESENKLMFVVDLKATKPQIKKEIEETFKVKVKNVNTFITRGEKKAYVQFAKETPAIDIATNLGLV